ncbi:crotonase/enoyl-CoA hydratase family protein [Stenotrophobium rhamnosiphilum]|uniref:Enoyl-CoA hydratase n=1 Tax=Stenotrophobium rhamnosiphilum TaxID=2029166 RepID=A0A2T5MH35_9GAMM|nr:crotonase/enoyl-CoA hydratase family protein [Stenotrophobium rhamnosiphilum]PTU31873.1 enoyl-CoA hydratase [Stenotrophobium rhamnosiphilum]
MSHIEVTTEGHILKIRVNRPEKHNALSPEMYSDIGKALAQLDGDQNLRVGVIHAEGKHFTSGIELDKWAPIFAKGNGFPLDNDSIDPFALQGRRCRKPLIIALQGNCFTWGVELMLTTDIRVAADDTKFAMLEVKRGIYPCGGATLRLPQQMGWSNAHRYLLTGEPWSAAESYRLGLVQEVVPAGAQLLKAMELAESIAKAAPLGVQAVLKSTRLAALEGEEEATKLLFKDLIPVMNSEDAMEGVRSFMERRDAKFIGR